MSLIYSVNITLADVPIVDNTLYPILINIIANVLTVLVSIFGILTNAVNILIFLRQGFIDQVNITLLALALSDLLALMAISVPTLVFFMAYKLFDVILYSGEISYITAGTVHLIFVRVTGWLTAFITFERCLCVTLPLHVKSLFTKQRVTCVVVTIYVFSFACLAPTYYTTRIISSYLPQINRSYLILVYTDDRAIIDHVTFIVGNVFPVMASFSIVVLSTIFLVVGLVRSTTFSTHQIQQLTTNNKIQVISRKKIKIIKLTSSLALIYIVTFTPTIIFTVWTIRDPGFSVTGFNRNFFNVAFSFSFLMESLNSSLHIFPYYSLSAKYRTSFRTLFTCCPAVRVP
ncbi:uncharacterized protein LOC131957924 [Physella acuta]|uniref:uncharacterized protein LOC131957924 n=1 Tax=Physella acuta TaxID=109671 RepID=UPI0027DB3CAC|nr:uncharacterized protein LOC131957924 [Physella acuta]